MKKRLFALLLASLLLLGVLAGCGGEPEDSAPQDSAPAQSSVSQPEEELPAAPETPDTPEPAASDQEDSVLEAEPEGCTYTGEWATYPLEGDNTLTMWCEFPGFLNMGGIDSYNGCSVFAAAEEATDSILSSPRSP